MLDVQPIQRTASYTSFSISSIPQDSEYVTLYVSNGDSWDMIDALKIGEKIGKKLIISSINDNSFYIDLNFIDFDIIFSQKFKLATNSSSGDIIDESEPMEIAPTGSDPLYGIVNKLSYEFNMLANFSGTNLLFIESSPIPKRCPECWDNKLKQRFKTVCGTCNNSGYIGDEKVSDVLARRVKTEIAQQYIDKGIDVSEQVVFQTYHRKPFIKGQIFIDKTRQQFYEVKGTHVSNIGGVRTSTVLIGRIVKPEDSRIVDRYLHLF